MGREHRCGPAGAPARRTRSSGAACKLTLIPGVHLIADAVDVAIQVHPEEIRGARGPDFGVASVGTGRVRVPGREVWGGRARRRRICRKRYRKVCRKRHGGSGRVNARGASRDRVALAAESDGPEDTDDGYGPPPGTAGIGGTQAGVLFFAARADPTLRGGGSRCGQRPGYVEGTRCGLEPRDVTGRAQGWRRGGHTVSPGSAVGGGGVSLRANKRPGRVPHDPILRYETG